MALRAEQLVKAAAKPSSLEAVVREQLRMIDAKIQSAPRSFGENVITIPLESSFSIPGLDKMEQQRFVYSSVIHSVKARGFGVRILLDHDNTRLFVSFKVRFDETELAAMNQTITGATITPDDLSIWMREVNNGGAGHFA